MIKDSEPENTKFTVAVLLATYQPDSVYLDIQVKSIMEQESVNIKLFWSDDSDSEIEHIKVKKILDRYPHINVTSDGKKGANQNFLHLLRSASDPDIDFYAFSDQDDIWMSDKLKRHAETLSEYESTVACTHSIASILRDGNEIESKSRCQNHKIETLLAENCIQGCTVMLNNAARKLILEVSPDGIAWYDWWIGSIISIAGIVVLVDGVDTVYRIHSNNLIGIPNKFDLIIRLKRYKNNMGFIQSLNLTKFANSFGDEKSKKEIQIWINGHSGALRERLKFSIFDKKRRKNIFEDIFRRIKSIRGLNLPE
jgi:rhamnosyltransferase